MSGKTNVPGSSYPRPSSLSPAYSQILLPSPPSTSPISIFRAYKSLEDMVTNPMTALVAIQAGPMTNENKMKHCVKPATAVKRLLWWNMILDIGSPGMLCIFNARGMCMSTDV